MMQSCNDRKKSLDISCLWIGLLYCVKLLRHWGPWNCCLYIWFVLFQYKTKVNLNRLVNVWHFAQGPVFGSTWTPLARITVGEIKHWNEHGALSIHSFNFCACEDGRFQLPRLTPTLPSSLRELRPRSPAICSSSDVTSLFPSGVKRADEEHYSPGPAHPLHRLLLLPPPPDFVPQTYLRNMAPCVRGTKVSD